MSQIFKTFLFILAGAIFLVFSIVKQCGDYSREKEAKKAQEQAAFDALPPEDKLRQKVEGITMLNYGETIDGLDILQLTTTKRFFGQYSLLMTIRDMTKEAYSIYPNLELLDIKINFSTTDTYGQAIEVPGLLYEIDRATYQKIRWETFYLNNLPTIATRWTPLHHQVKQ